MDDEDDGDDDGDECKWVHSRHYRNISEATATLQKHIVLYAFCTILCDDYSLLLHKENKYMKFEQEIKATCINMP